MYNADMTAKNSKARSFKKSVSLKTSHLQLGVKALLNENA